MNNQQNLKTARTLIAGGLLASTLIAGVNPAHADVSQSNIQSLNPRQQKYNRCPKDADCYILSTRIISGQVADPSELSGDENYILPIWSIIDGMGVDVHPLPLTLTTSSESISLKKPLATWEGGLTNAEQATQSS